MSELIDEIMRRFDANAEDFDRVMLAARSMLSYQDKDITLLRSQNRELVDKVKVLIKHYDDHVGTPCEQIRHSQEIERLHKSIAICVRENERVNFEFDSDAVTYFLEKYND